MLATIISPFVALVSGLLLWFLNEIGKRKHQVYLEKLRLYENLILSIEGFYQGSKAINKRQNFNNKLALAWMYCSKEVIEKADTFLETTREGNKYNEQERAEALHKLMQAIRSDMKLQLPRVKFKAWISK